MTISDYRDALRLGALSCIYLCFIGGVNKAFVNYPLPAVFRDGNNRVRFRGEDYIPSTTLTVDNWVIDQKLQPMGGLPQAASLSLSFRQPGSSGHYATAVWPDLLAVGENRDDGKITTWLMRDIPPEGGITTILVHERSPLWAFPWTDVDPLILYVGREAIAFRPTAGAATNVNINLGGAGGESVTAQEIDGMQVPGRGAFGSVIQEHIADIGTTVAGEASGAFAKISEYVRSLGGLYVELFGVLGRVIGREFVPLGKALDGPFTMRFFSGVIQAVDRGGNLMEPTLKTTSVDSRLHETIIQRAPKVTVQSPGAKMQNGAPFSVRIGPHNRYLFASASSLQNQTNPARTEIYFREQPVDGDQIIFVFPGTSGGTTGTTTYTFTYKTTPATLFDIPVGVDIKATVNATRSVLNRELGADSVVAGLPAWHKALQVERPNNRTLQLRWGNPAVFTPFEYGVSLSVGFADTRAFLNSDTLAGTQKSALDTGSELVRSVARDGAAPFEAIPTGTILNLNDLAEVIGDSITRSLGPPYVATCQLSPTQVDPSNPTEPPRERMRTQLRVTISNVSDPDTFALFLSTRSGPLDSILRDLGFRDPLVELEYRSYQSANTVICSGLSDSGIPIFRWPRLGVAQPTTLTVRQDSLWSLTHFNDAGWTDDAGNLLPKFALIDDKLLISFDQIQTEGGLLELQGIVTSPAPPYNNDLDEEYFVEWKADEEQRVTITRVWSLAGMSIGRAFNAIMLSGSGGSSNSAAYDHGWPGCGLLIPRRMINVQAFEDLVVQRPNILDNLVIKAGDTGREILGDLCLENAFQVAHHGGELYPLVIEPPTRSRVTLSHSVATHTLTQADIVSDLRTGMGVDDGAGRISNEAAAKAGLRNHSGKTSVDLDVKDGTSIAEFGRQPPLSLTIRGQFSAGDVSVIGRRIQGRVIKYLGQRRMAYEVDVGKYYAWLFRPGDIVFLTHTELPTLDKRRTRSVTNLPVRVMVNKQYITGKSQGRGNHVWARLTLVDYGSEGPQRGDWAPSMVIALDDGLYRAQAHAFSDPADSLEDGDYFAAGYRIQAWPYGDPTSGFTEAIIDSVTQEGGHNRIFTFSEALAPGNHIVTFVPYDNAGTTDDQRTWVFFSDDAGKLRRPGGALDPGYVYF